MGLKDFFSNDFFTVIVGVSAFIGIAIYLDAARDKIKYNFYKAIMNTRIKKLKDHCILLGYGRVGVHIAKEFMAEKTNFVVIDKSEEAISECESKKLLCMQGNVTESDNVLKDAGLNRAKVVVIAFGEDADNIAAAISVKALRGDVFTVARANTLETVDKLEKLGVNRVIQPNQIGGYHMATMALRPGVVDFLDVIIDSKRDDLQIEELLLDKGSRLIGDAVSEHFSGANTPVLLLAIKKTSGELLLKPRGSSKMNLGDKLIIMGSKNSLMQFTDTYT